MPLDGAPISQLPLPEGWALSERVEDVVHVEGLAIRRAGLCATSADGQAVGSAADIGDDPSPRAAFELLERIALAESCRRSKGTFPVRSAAGDELGDASIEDVFPSSDEPDRWAHARSNGASLHADWAMACEAAAAELVERDRLLRAWLGETLPVRIGNGSVSGILPGTASYEWRTYLFPAPDGLTVGRDLEVAGVFGFPTCATMPVAFGFGARRHLHDAVAAARREALQTLAFLWGEPIPEREPDPTPTAMTHLETYQVADRRAVLLRWLENGHVAHHRPRAAAGEATLRFADLTPAWLEGRLHVAKALCAEAIPLVFGHAPLLAHLPSELRIHPIP